MVRWGTSFSNKIFSSAYPLQGEVVKQNECIPTKRNIHLPKDKLQWHKLLRTSRSCSHGNRAAGSLAWLWLAKFWFWVAHSASTWTIPHFLGMDVFWPWYLPGSTSPPPHPPPHCKLVAWGTPACAVRQMDLRRHILHVRPHLDVPEVAFYYLHI